MTMQQVTIYRTDGSVRQTLSFDKDQDVTALMPQVLEPGEGWIEGEFGADLWRFVDGAPVMMPPRPSPAAVFDYAALEWTNPITTAVLIRELQDAQQRAMDLITKIRAEARRQYVTDIPGQDAIYSAKYDEARTYLADPDPQPNDYPLIMSEVGVTAEAPAEVAQVFLNLNALWRHAAGALDAACFAAQNDVLEATSEADIDTVVAGLVSAINVT